MSIQRYDMWTCFDSDIARMMEGEDGEYVKHADHLAAIEAAKMDAGVCIWSFEGDGSGCWHTSCGSAFEIYDGTPSENEMKFCCYCGSSIEEDLPQ